MRHFGIPAPASVRRPVPRGIARSGPPILSYGFRPFFLLAGIVACLDMIVWIGGLSGYWGVGGPEGPIAWHGHEMLFGYAAAALCGFILAAIPNWTGRLPVSGVPLLVLVLLWCAGRMLLLFPVTAGSLVGPGIDALFLPTLAVVVVREVVTGRNWQNLRVAGAICGLALLNIAFHLTVVGGWDVMPVLRATVAVYVLLVCIIGGRIIPSFTRNYLAKRGKKKLPRPMGLIDHAAIIAALTAGLIWAAWPDSTATVLLGSTAAALNGLRLSGWQGHRTFAEPLLAVLHVAYAFVPLGFAAVAVAATGLVAPASAVHILTVGVIGMSTLAVMTRASRGHTGRALCASPATTASYTCLFLAAILRPAAELLPDFDHMVLAASGTAWIAAFAIYLVEHVPMLVGRSKISRSSKVLVQASLPASEVRSTLGRDL